MHTQTVIETKRERERERVLVRPVRPPDCQQKANALFYYSPYFVDFIIVVMAIGPSPTTVAAEAALPIGRQLGRTRTDDKKRVKKH